MKIGMLSYPGIAGCGIVAVELAHELAGLGCEVHFVSSEVPFRLEPERPNLWCHLARVCEFELFKYPDAIFPLVSKTAEVIQAQEVDVLHAHYAVPFGIIALMARELAPRRPRVVLTLHGTDITTLSRDARYRDVVRYCIEQSDVVTAVSESLIKEVKAGLGIRKSLRLIRNFPTVRHSPSAQPKLRDRLNIRADEFLLLHMSNLRPMKRIENILQALTLCSAKPKLLVLAGGDPRVCEATIASLNLKGRVHVLRNVHNVGEHINIADAGVYASESEQCSLAMLETMALGKPVVATNSGGTPEVLGDTGLLFDVGDVQTLAQHIDALAGDPTRRRKLGSEARRRVNRIFSRQAIVNQYLGAYSD